MLRTPADSQQTEWSDPAAHHARLGELPSEPAAIADALEEFVIHHAVARQIGFPVPAYAEDDRSLRRSALLLDTLLQRDARPLSIHRDLPDYLYVTCRDFALLAITALRAQGIPARLRAGFASYFAKGHWEDHYICEYRRDGQWAVLDAQLGRRARDGMRVPFDVANVPSSGWRSAPSVWRTVRTGEIDATTCGLTYADIKGEWWIASSVIRDAATLAGIECLPWDNWGPTIGFRETRSLTPEQAQDIDALAQALDPAPPDRHAAQAVLAQFPWAAPPQDAFGAV
ncbi:transglutaminase domain-containing protein [Bradyrhizobium sp. SYSU BS000235]|uniref:transglutaminase domain-containing protein n=1 Tax=Bradyrhizobium sp. SYSU BS000235 TaxID=3411332 RepID=UPI003C745FCB